MKIDNIFNELENFILTAEDRYDRRVLKYLTENWDCYTYCSGIGHQVRTHYNLIGGHTALAQDLKEAQEAIKNAPSTKNEKGHLEG